MNQNLYTEMKSVSRSRKRDSSSKTVSTLQKLCKKVLINSSVIVWVKLVGIWKDQKWVLGVFQSIVYHVTQFCRFFHEGFHKSPGFWINERTYESFDGKILFEELERITQSKSEVDIDDTFTIHLQCSMNYQVVADREAKFLMNNSKFPHTLLVLENVYQRQLLWQSSGVLQNKRKKIWKFGSIWHFRDIST